MARLYSLLTIKAVNSEKRTIAGIASTPAPDRLGDVVEPLGISFKNPVPLLLYHNTQKPVGAVTFNPPTFEGLTFEASIPEIKEAGTVRDRVEEAWHSIKAGLLHGVSIGFRAIEEAYMKETGAFRFIKTEVLELSLVAIPANADATIHTIKALDLAALGRPSPGVSGSLSPRARSAPPMTIQEQITAYENTRATRAARISEIMAAAAADSVTLNPSQSEEYDRLAEEVRQVDTHLERLRAWEQTQLTQARPITPALAADPHAAAAARAAGPVITVKANVPIGTGWVRYVQAMVACKGVYADAIQFANRWKDSTPEVAMVLRAAVAPGNTTTVGWAAELAPLKPLTDQFLEYLRPATILGKITGMIPVPFNVSVASQTGGGTYQWVGEAKPKPVGKLTTGSVTLGIAKCSGIIVITEELARVSTPSAEEIIRRDMRDGIAAFLDLEFTDPTKAAVAGVSPGSVTNGVTPITSTGTGPVNARSDIAALLAAITNAGGSAMRAHLIMSENNAMALGFSISGTGQSVYPGLTPGGGTINGINVVTSQAVGANVIALDPQGVMLADEGGLSIDVSREASLQMDSAPMSPPDATVVLTSLWQNNLIGLRAERFINWKKVRTGFVQYTTQTYIPGAVVLAAAESSERKAK